MATENVTGQWNMGKVSERVESVNRMNKSICFCLLTQGEKKGCGFKGVLASPHRVELLKTEGIYGYEWCINSVNM